jgi:2-polyprenyl-3-methyl-5-hydroxy-6-metoxy-1,4-benzoquinol methylase
MQTFWDERYATSEYVYGTEPNAYYRNKIKALSPGKILLPGEGEGRNAVYAASKGWAVTAFDTSIEGQKKARQLSELKGVNIDYRLTSYEHFNNGKVLYDVIGLFYTHTSESLRKKFHNDLIHWLAPGGIVIMEAFHKDQINRNTGGPRNIDLLYDEQTLQEDFKALQIIELNTQTVELNEGPFHQGTAEVIRFTGKK